jgi:predicted HicB family RNase H-like nuclease
LVMTRKLRRAAEVEEGETMSKATYPLKLPLSIKKAAQRLAKEDGVSLNQWIAAAVAEKSWSGGNCG